MKIEKITEEYTFTESGGRFILDFGTIPFNIPVKAKFRISDVESAKFRMGATCGCTVLNAVVIDTKIVEQEIKYNAAIKNEFEKTVIITNAGKEYELKLKGTAF